MHKQVWMGLVMVLAQAGIGSVTARAQATWTDPATGLMWARADSGEDQNWKQAGAYCAHLKLDGYSEWRLPTIDELAAIYDPTQWVGCGNRIKGEIDISGSMNWSSSAGKASGEAWVFNFLIGKKASKPLVPIQKEDIAIRALCVRRP